MRRQHLAIDMLVALTIGAASAAALAQGSASAPRPASSPGAGPGPGPGMMQGAGMHGWQANSDNTPGWGMMSSTERDEHHRDMLGMTNADECKAYMNKHRADMTARAKQRGSPAPGAVAPRHDPCARLTTK
jgi:hypothetical protein